MTPADILTSVDFSPELVSSEIARLICERMKTDEEIRKVEHQQWTIKLQHDRLLVEKHTYQRQINTLLGIPDMK